MKIRETGFVLLLAGVFVISSCSINKMAINAVSNALTGEGSSEVFTGDPDIQLVGDALPFAIKMYEALLSQNPNHQGLLLTTGSLFIMYANAFVQGPADMLPITAYAEQAAAKQRAKELYLRGADILYSALDKKYPGFSRASVQDGTLEPLLRKCKKVDAGLLYWTVAGVMAAYSIDVFDFELANRIPELGAMVKRAYELDPDYGVAAIDEFLILFYASLPPNLGGNREAAETHFRRAVEKSGGNLAGPYVSYALAISVPDQNYDSYIEMLESALAVNLNADPANRLVNVINQRKAAHLLETAYMHFSFLPDPFDLDEW